MKIWEEFFPGGAFDLSIEMRPEEIGALIAALVRLRAESDWHFHIVNEGAAESNRLYDIEISCNPDAPDEFLTRASGAIRRPRAEPEKTPAGGR